MKTTEPNQAVEPTIIAVTDHAPSSMLRASLNVSYVSAWVSYTHFTFYE